MLQKNFEVLSNKKQSKHGLSKFEQDLFKEESDCVEKVISVKRTLINKIEKWKLFENDNVVLTIDGYRLTNKEKSFLRTIDGFNFLIKQYKSGVDSFSTLKGEIKKVLAAPCE